MPNRIARVTDCSTDHDGVQHISQVLVIALSQRLFCDPSKGADRKATESGDLIGPASPLATGTSGNNCSTAEIVIHVD